jgi:hypothetical protein
MISWRGKQPCAREIWGAHAGRLQPDLPEAHLAFGFSYYYGDIQLRKCSREKDSALTEAQRVTELLPKSLRQRSRWNWPKS